MDIMQKIHPQDYVLVMREGPYRNGAWLRRHALESLQRATKHQPNVRYEVQQTAAYGTEEWRIANETVMS